MRPSFFERLLILYARSFPIRRGKLRVVNALWQFAAGHKSTSRFTELRHGRFKIPCDIEEMLQRQLYFFGTYFLEEKILDCWSTAARNADMVFDVGANAGVFSFAALAVQSKATIHAFEPTPEIAARLRQAATLNNLGHLQVHETAVSAENGEATLGRCRGELGTNEGMNFIVLDSDDSGAERVRTVCLDQFCLDRGIKRIDLLKLDIQGHEQSALEGARQLIETGSIGTIFFELNWAAEAGVCSPASESIRILDQAGYWFSIPDRRQDWRRAGSWLETLNFVVARKSV